MPLPMCIEGRLRHGYRDGFCMFCGMPAPSYLAAPKVKKIKIIKYSERQDPLATGYDAFGQGVPRPRNPFRNKTPEFVAWDDGWVAAQSDANRPKRWQEEFEEKLKGVQDVSGSE